MPRTATNLSALRRERAETIGWKPHGFVCESFRYRGGKAAIEVRAVALGNGLHDNKHIGDGLRFFTCFDSYPVSACV
jgi:hypothetical protein